MRGSLDGGVRHHAGRRRSRRRRRRRSAGRCTASTRRGRGTPRGCSSSRRTSRSGPSGRSADRVPAGGRPTGGSTSPTPTAKLFALDTKRVKARWTYRSRRCSAASPAIDNHTVFMTFLNKPPCNATRSGLDGQVVALNADTGKVRWRLKIGPSETSPLVVDGVVYVGDWTATSTRSRRDRATRWTYQTGDKVKGASPTPAAASTSARTTTTSTPERPDGQAVLARDGAAAARLARQFLLDACRRLRPRLHRLDRRQGLLVRRHEREAPLVARHGRLRLLLAGRLEQRVCAGSYSGTSTASMPPRATCAGSSTRTARSRARRS